MNQKCVFLILLFAVLIGCQSSKTVEKEQIARDYYHALDESNFERIAELQYDSIRIKEGPFNSTYTVSDYVNWLQWDSVFQPTYEILDAKLVDETVELSISKLCKRIEFLNGGPMVSKERMQFKDGKIYMLEIGEFTSFNAEQWNAQREDLVNWVKINHPELDGFINDQSLQGGLNYLKALELYQNRADSLPSL